LPIIILTGHADRAFGIKSLATGICYLKKNVEQHGGTIWAKNPRKAGIYVVLVLVIFQAGR